MKAAGERDRRSERTNERTRYVRLGSTSLSIKFALAHSGPPISAHANPVSRAINPSLRPRRRANVNSAAPFCYLSSDCANTKLAGVYIFYLLLSFPSRRFKMEKASANSQIFFPHQPISPERASIIMISSFLTSGERQRGVKNHHHHFSSVAAVGRRRGGDGGPL